jgi:hypothetical protein
MGQLAEWCELEWLENAVLRHDDPSDDNHLEFHKAYVTSWDIKPKRQLIQIIISFQWFIAIALLSIETGRVVQINTTLHLLSVTQNFNMTALDFCSDSMGACEQSSMLVVYSASRCCE